jgi:hypothetical protein
LIEKNILLQLTNSDAKEFAYRWQHMHEEANKKLQSLDNAINDVQNWERRLLSLQDWINYMDKYLSTRIDQDIFAEDVSEDFVVRIPKNHYYTYTNSVYKNSLYICIFSIIKYN